MVSKCQSYLVIFSILWYSVKGDLFSAAQDLNSIFIYEKQLVNTLQNYVSKTEIQLEKIRRYVNKYQSIRAQDHLFNFTDSIGEERREVEAELAGNPIQAYSLFKRLTDNLKQIEMHSNQKERQSVHNALKDSSIVDPSLIPQNADFEGVMTALVRLQTVYKFSAAELVQGNISGIITRAELTLYDCAVLAKVSFFGGNYVYALDWMRQAYILNLDEPNPDEYKHKIIEHMDVYRAKIKEEKTNTKSLLARIKKKTSPSPGYTLGNSISVTETNKNFYALCRGEQMLTEEYKATLKCFLDTRRSPYFILRPAKVEVFYHDPLIYMFHDVVTESENHLLRKTARPFLVRAMVQAPDGVTQIESSSRTAKTTFMPITLEDLLFDQLNKKIGYFSDLVVNRNSAESLQVGNYGIGGFYTFHHDFFEQKKLDKETTENILPFSNQGNRVATFMLYLTDVGKGGSTVFPKLGVSLPPVRNGAAFWYNMKRNGSGNDITIHGGCPVLYGSKWVVNKWIREYQQFRKRPCTLSPDE